MKIISKLYKGLTDLSSACSFLSVVLMMLVITVDSLGTFFRHPLIGNMEIVVVLMVCVVFFGVAECARSDDMIKVDIFRGWPWLDHFSYIVIALLGFLISYQTVLQALFSKDMNDVSMQLDIPNWPFVFVTAFGFFMVGISGLIKKARAAKTGEETLPETGTQSEQSGEK